jgi:hypothetical protein
MTGTPLVGREERAGAAGVREKCWVDADGPGLPLVARSAAITASRTAKIIRMTDTRMIISTIA